MVKALFVFTGLGFENGGRFYNVTLTSDVFHKLYFPYCDRLIICQRIKHIDDPVGLTEVKSDDIEFICPPYSPSSFSLYLINRVKYFRFIEKLVKEADFVVERPGILGCAAAKYARKYDKPYICEVTGDVFASYWHHSFGGKFLAFFRNYDAKKTIKKSKYTIYVTQEYLQKKYPCNGYCAGISDVEIEKLENSVLEKRLKKIDDYREDHIYSMTTVAGVNARAKGQVYALKAIKKLKKKGIFIRYYLVGEGDQTYLRRKAKRYKISDQVIFTGAMKHQNVYSFLTDMDLYIQPSLHEGLPRAVVEAMSKALPCLGSRTAGIPELIPDEMIFRKKGVKQICRIIESLNKEKLKQYARMSFEKAKEFEQASLKQKRNFFFSQFLKDNNLNK